jgi:hypothetical protein
MAPCDFRRAVRFSVVNLTTRRVRPRRPALNTVTSDPAFGLKPVEHEITGSARDSTSDRRLGFFHKANPICLPDPSRAHVSQNSRPIPTLHDQLRDPRSVAFKKSPSGQTLGSESESTRSRRANRSAFTAALISGYLSPRIWPAKRAAFTAPAFPIASVPTGIPLGI